MAAILQPKLMINGETNRKQTLKLTIKNKSFSFFIEIFQVYVKTI